MTSARSISFAGTLTMTQGRTLAARPRSTTQTSPRVGGRVVFPAVEVEEKRVRHLDEGRIRQGWEVDLKIATQDCGSDLGFLFGRELIELFDDLASRERHVQDLDLVGWRWRMLLVRVHGSGCCRKELLKDRNMQSLGGLDALRLARPAGGSSSSKTPSVATTRMIPYVLFLLNPHHHRKPAAALRPTRGFGETFE